METTTETKKCSFDKIKKNSKLSATYYLNVLNVNRDSIDVEDQIGTKFNIQGKNLIEETINSADQWNTVVSLSRTELITILENAGDTVFTANFNKQANEETVANALSQLSIQDLTTPKTLKRHLKSILLGEERTISGYLVKSEPKMGRSTVVDLEVPKNEHNLRQIDHRSIQYLVIKNIKYIVK